MTMAVDKPVWQTGANANARARSGGSTALHWVANRGLRQAVRRLLEAGGDTKVADSDGDTAIELAEMAGHKDIAELLRWGR